MEMWNNENNFPANGFSTPPPAWKTRPVLQFPLSERKHRSPSSCRPDLFHVMHKVPAGDSLYVKAKHVQALQSQLVEVLRLKEQFETSDDVEDKQNEDCNSSTALSMAGSDRSDTHTSTGARGRKRVFSSLNITEGDNTSHCPVKRQVLRRLEPFVVFKSPRVHYGEIFFRSNMSTQRIQYDHPIDIRQWTIAGHDAENGWILLFKNTFVVYYNIWEGRWFTICSDLPCDLGTDQDSVKGCFSGDPEKDTTVTMIVKRLTSGIQVLKYSKASGAWTSSQKRTESLYAWMAHVNADGKYMWLDGSTAKLHLIHNWAKPKMKHTTYVLEENLRSVQASSALVNSDVYLISYHAEDGIRVYLLDFTDDNVVSVLLPNLGGNVIYTSNCGTGFSVLPNPTQPRQNTVVISGYRHFHCTSCVYENDAATWNNVEKLCFDLRLLGPGIVDCTCQAIWFNLRDIDLDL